MGFNTPTLDEVIEFTNDTNKVHYASMGNRMGINGWLTQVEYTYFKPDTPMQEKFDMTVMKWPDDLEMIWVIASMPIEFEERATHLLWQHGLKVAGVNDPSGEKYTFMVIGGPEGKQTFPLQGDTVRCLENHNQGAQNVAYTNDPEKIRAAYEHEEKQIIAKFHADHAAWLATPEGFAEAEVYWKTRPDIYPPEQKPDFTGGANPRG